MNKEDCNAIAKEVARVMIKTIKGVESHLEINVSIGWKGGFYVGGYFYYISDFEDQDE